MSDSSKNTANSQPDINTLKNHQITELPFVSNNAGNISENRNFWTVQPSGDYGEECDLGTEYAYLAVNYMIKKDMPCLVSWVANDMQLVKYSGINVGFMSTIAEMAMGVTA